MVGDCHHFCRVLLVEVAKAANGFTPLRPSGRSAFTGSAAFCSIASSTAGVMGRFAHAKVKNRCQYKQQRQQHCSKAAEDVGPKVICQRSPWAFFDLKRTIPGSRSNNHLCLEPSCITQSLLRITLWHQSPYNVNNKAPLGAALFFFLSVGDGAWLSCAGYSLSFRPWRSEAKRKSKHTEAFLHRPVR